MLMVMQIHVTLKVPLHALSSAPNAVLAFESVSFDGRGNATTNRVFRNRAAVEEISWAKNPAPMAPAVAVATNSLLASATSHAGVTYTYGYDAFGREVSRTDGLGNTARTTYDPFGRVSSTVDALGASTTYGYDALGRQTSVTDPLGNTVYTAYDAAGRRVGVAKSGTAFEKDDSISYAYNGRSELTNAVAAVDSDYRYAYDFDDIGNRVASAERGTNVVYSANSLNQYTAVDDFTPQFDDDGNQTLVKTATGIWSVTYNGENRPIFWTNGSTNIVMSFDRMGRRVTKNEQCFVYDGYLQIANLELVNTNSQLTTHNSQLFIWDPAEPVATRPLAWISDVNPAYYTHDGNKNVSEVIATNDTLTAHYEYAPFGAATTQCGTFATANPWHFSSEYAEDDTVTVYYNFRHYEPVMGRWFQRDPEDERGGLNLYCICNCVYQTDVLGRNRYITQFDILNYGGSGGTQFHVGVAVDRWICRKGQWEKNGITTFDFSIDWEAPWYNYLLGGVWKARGRIVSSSGLTLVAPITLKSCPSQDVKMFSMIKEEMKNPPFYNGVFHNCLFWSVGAINYGMSEKCNDCCEE